MPYFVYCLPRVFLLFEARSGPEPRVAFEHILNENSDCLKLLCYVVIVNHLKGLWLSSSDHHHLAETLNLTYLPTTEGSDIQHKPLPTTDIHLVETSISDHSTTAFETAHLPIVVQTEPVFHCVVKAYSDPPCVNPTLDECNRLYDEINRQLQSVESESVELYAGRLHCLMKFFSCEFDANRRCNESLNFPYCVLEQFTDQVSSDSNLSSKCEPAKG